MSWKRESRFSLCEYFFFILASWAKFGNEVDIEDEGANDVPDENSDEEGGIDTGPTSSRPRVNSVDFFLENADKPIFDGACMTVVQAAYT
jgi:hypothetical protein